MHRTRYGEMAQGIHVLSEHATLLGFPCVYQPGSSENAILWGFYGGFIT